MPPSIGFCDRSVRENMFGGVVNLSALFSYFLLGISLAAPVGPVNAAQLDKGVKFGFLHAWLFGIGAFLADVLYMFLVYLGVVHFLETPFMKTFLWSFGCFVLVYSGVENFLKAGDVQIKKSRKAESKTRTFLSGFSISVSNPLTILFWLGIYGSVLAKTASSFGFEQLLIYSAAICIGILAWDFTMSIISSSARKYLNSRALSFISIISSLFMIGFGIYFGIEAAKLIFAP